MKGLTLIEVVVSTAIMSIIILALFTVCDSGQSLYSSNTKLMDVMQVARQPMQGMIKELRQSKPADIIILNSGAQIQFVVPTSIDPVVYSQPIRYYLNNDQLIREHPLGATAILANNIDSINFQLTANRIEVNLQARARHKQQDLVLPVNETITLRN